MRRAASPPSASSSVLTARRSSSTIAVSRSFIGSGKLMLPWAHDQHRARRMPHDSLGGAAQEQVFQSGVPVSGDDDEVDVAFLGHAHNLLIGLAAAHNRFHRNQFLNLPLAQGGQLAVDVLFE